MTCISLYVVMAFLAGLDTCIGVLHSVAAERANNMNDKIFSSARACLFLLPGTSFFAQQAPDIFSGSPGVLYAQSQLLRSIDQPWLAPLSHPYAPLAASVVRIGTW